MTGQDTPKEEEKKPAKAPRPPGPPLVELGLGVAWLLGTAAALQAVELAIGRYVIGAALGGAVIADIGSSLAGVRWSDKPGEPWTVPLARVGRGAGVATLVVGATFAVGAALGWLQVGAGTPSLAVFLAVLKAASIAVRDELLWRGIPLTVAARAGAPPWTGRVFGALAGAASIALVPGANLAAAALAAALGWLFAGLWQRERGGFSAVGAHAAWAVLTGAVLRGSLLDTTWAQGNLGLGARASGGPAWIAATIAVLVAVALPRLPGFRVKNRAR